jgi:hypothetical protein
LPEEGWLANTKLQKEAVCSSETLISTKLTMCHHNPENHKLKTQCQKTKTKMLCCHSSDCTPNGKKIGHCATQSQASGWQIKHIVAPVNVMKAYGGVEEQLHILTLALSRGN